jgi:uncharacterized protein involved in type VI secretion and phage assembly
MNFESLKSKNEMGGVFPGPVIALVTSLEDPEKMGRIKVKFPWLDDKIESGWTPVAMPFAGKERGIQFLPEVGDEVLVLFQMGNFQKPVIIGSLWNGKDTPPSNGQDGKNFLKVIKTTLNHKIEFSDDQDDSYILITDGKGNNSIKLDMKNELIEIKSTKNISIQSENGEIEIKAKKVTIEGASQLELKSKSGKVVIDGPSGVDIKGSTINLN